MIANYHTHTSRCGHAVGTDEEYVLAAIDRGLRVIGFADHAPMIYPDGYRSTFKMLPEEIGGYFSSLLSLKEKYKDKIDIKIGFETEYYPDLWETALSFWRPYPLDYLILGQHFISGEGYIAGARYTGNPHGDASDLIAYTDRVIAAMGTGLITYIAHPDLFNFTGDLDLYRQQVQRMVTASNRLGVPLEINLLGLSEGRSYPKECFWREAGRLSARAFIGCDAHSPGRVADPDEIMMAMRYAEKFGIEILDTAELRWGCFI